VAGLELADHLVRMYALLTVRDVEHYRSVVVGWQVQFPRIVRERVYPLIVIKGEKKPPTYYHRWLQNELGKALNEASKPGQTIPTEAAEEIRELQARVKIVEEMRAEGESPERIAHYVRERERRRPMKTQEAREHELAGRLRAALEATGRVVAVPRSTDSLHSKTVSWDNGPGPPIHAPGGQKT